MRILLIRLRLIGDVVFTTPAIRGLRRRYPGARLVYLVEEASAPVVARNPHLDEVRILPKLTGAARVVEDLRLARTLRRERYDVVIDFHGGPRSSFLAWASGAPRRIGYTVAGRSWMYTDVVDRPRVLRARHSVENQWDLLAPLGIPAPDPERDPVEMVEAPDAAARVTARLSAAGVSPAEQLIVVHVSAGNPFRRWPASSFVALAAALARHPNRRVVLTAGPSEAGAADAIAHSAQSQLPGEAAGRVLRCGEFDLAELRALVDRAALFIGGDSGPLHVASTTRTPIVGLYGPTLPARSAPWRSRQVPSAAVEPPPLACRPCDQRVCEPGDFRCLTGIPAEAVVTVADRLLASSEGRRAEPIAAGQRL